MAANHTGNTQPQIDQEEHTRISGIDGKKMFVFDNVGNQVTSFGGSPNTGNVTINPSPNFIGLATVNIGSSNATLFAVVNTAAAGQSSIVLDTGANYVGLVTVANTVPVTFSGNVTLDDGSLTGIVGNVTISDSKGFIGLTTTTLGASPAFIGIVTTTNQLPLVAGTAYIGSATVNIASNNGTDIGDVNLLASAAFIGIVTIANTNVRSITGNLTLSDAKTFIGLTTAIAINGGTNKTLIPLTLPLSTSSIATIVVPTGGNAIFKITNLLLNSNATVRLSIKSNSTYLTGNASLGINLNPGGGWVENGSPDSPVYIGLASGAAIVLEKADYSGVISQIGGKLIYFSE